MKIFTVVVTFNGIRWIDKCIKSLQHSSVMSEIIVVDNKSADGTAEYLGQCQGIALIENENNVGFGPANNIGIKYALERDADFVFLLNQDAWVNFDTLENLVNASIQNSEFGIISPVHLNGSGTNLDLKFSDYVSERCCSGFLSDFVLKNDEKHLYPVPFVNAAAWLLPAATIKKIGGFNEAFFMYGEDEDYCSRALYHQFKIGVLKDAVIYHIRDSHFFKKHSYLEMKRIEAAWQKMEVLRLFFIYIQEQPLHKILYNKIVLLLKMILHLRVENAIIRAWALVTSFFILELIKS